MNHLTHFKKNTILRFVLAGLVLLFSVPALFADGIASRYPNDVGIENDPDVLLYDGFETYTSPSQLSQNWSKVGGVLHMRIATEPGDFFAGKKALEMRTPVGGGGPAIFKLFNPGLTTLFVRAYQKWDPTWNITGAAHNGIVIHGDYPGPCGGTPRDGTGWFLFALQNVMMNRIGERQPGYSEVYAYWPLQHSGCGDHWLPPVHFIPIRGAWYCYELMVKLNSIGSTNGEVKFWIDGQLIGQWSNLFIRGRDSLLIDTVFLNLFDQKTSVEKKKWYDEVVIATSYIGPISPPKPISMAAVADFNSDGSPDYVLRNASTRQTAIWYLNNNVFVSAAWGPTLPGGWNVIDVADFNLDGNLDYALLNASTRQTAIWYLSGVAFVRGAYGPTLPSGWTLLATADFNGDGKPDYVLYNGSTRRTAVWYMNNNVFVSAAYGPTLPAGWNVIDVADFNLDGNLDYALFNASTRQTAIWYLSGVAFVRGAPGPTLPSGWTLLATADFNGDGKSDYVLFNPSTRRTAIWYLNNNIFIGSAYGPTLP
jgi:hypothetical protein